MVIKKETVYDFLILGANGLQGKIVTRMLAEKKKYSMFLSDKEDLTGMFAGYAEFRKVNLKNNDEVEKLFK